MSDFFRVTSERPCPICGHPDFCGISRNLEVVCCMRQEVGAFSTKETPLGPAYFHKMKAEDKQKQDEEPPPPKSNPNATRMIRNLCRNATLRISNNKIEMLVNEMHVAPAALKRLRVGWWFNHDNFHLRSSIPRKAQKGYLFPMSDPQGNTVGASMRLVDKRAVREYGSNKILLPGSNAFGMFVPSDLTFMREAVFINEGVSDCAAALSMGLESVGRLSNQGPAQPLIDLLRARGLPGDTRAIIIADRDEPGSVAAQNTARGAATLLRRLRDAGIEATAFQPPEGIKDMREWYMSGATETDVINHIVYRNPFNP